MSTRNRNRRNGQYLHDFDVVCRCGRRFGDHLAEPPYDADEHGEEYCPGFKATTERRSAPTEAV